MSERQLSDPPASVFLDSYTTPGQAAAQTTAAAPTRSGHHRAYTIAAAASTRNAGVGSARCTHSRRLSIGN